MKNLKLLSIILCISMLAMVFAGCNSGAETPAPTPPAEDPVYAETFISYASTVNDGRQVKEINADYHSAGRITVTEGFLSQINVFMGKIGDVTLSLYKWNTDYDTTVAGTPIKQKVFLKTELTKFEVVGSYNMEMSFEENEIGAGTYLFLLSEVEGSTNKAAIYTASGWTSKTFPEKYKPFEIESYANGKKTTREAPYASAVVKTETQKVEKAPLPTEKDPEGTAKVILIGGQSNAVGVSQVSELQKQVSAEKFEEYTNGYSNVQIIYENLSGNSNYTFGNVKIGQGVDAGSFGPELGIAEYLSKAFPDETFYIIKYALGGSVLETQWYNAKTESAGLLLNGLVSITNSGLAQLEEMGLNPKIVGFVWNQGESDSIEVGRTSRYYANQAGLVDYVRTTFEDRASVRGIAFFDAGIVGNLWPAYKYTNIQKYQYSLTSPINFYIETTNYPDINTLEENNDMAHYDALAMIKLGQLYGAEIEKILK